MLFNPDDRRVRSTVRVVFAQVWQVLRSDDPQMDMEEIEEARGLLYSAPEVLSTYARQGRRLNKFPYSLMEQSLPRHPLDKYYQSQLDFLAALPEAQRFYHARLFRLDNSSYRY